LPAATQGVAFSQTLTASGGTPAYTWAIASGSLPAGVTLTSGGSLSGTPTASGNYTFTVRATDAGGCQADRSYTMAIQCPTIAISPTTLTAATLNSSYGPVTLTATGGTAAYTWTYAGSLPVGMGLSSGGVISGTPSGAPGNYTITVTATDANGCVSNRGYTLAVNCGAFSITPSSLPAVTQGTAYSAQTLTATGGTGPYVWDVSVGTLPTGMSLSAAGVISGTPTSAPGTYNITVRATDTYSCQSTRAYALVVNCPTVTVSPSSVPNAVQYVSYSQTLTASGGTGPYTWTQTSGTLPTGMSFSSAGVLSGTPTVTGTFSLVLRAQDANGCFGSRSYAITVACPVITITPATLPDAQNNVAYSQTLTASGGTAPYTWSKTTGNLPTGVSLSSAGVLSGTPISGPGDYNFTVQAMDAAMNCSGSLSYTLKVVCPTITVTPNSLTNGTVGTAYSRGLSSASGTAPYTYSITVGALPAGISLSSSGLISGTPTVATVASFTVQSQDVFGCIGTQAYTLTTVCPTLTISPTSLGNAYYGQAYSSTLSVTGGTGPYTWTRTSGTLPSGMTLSSAGVISGTSTTFGTSTFTVRATDAYGCSATMSYSLTVKALSIGNLIYEDANFNGVRDVGEPGVQGVVVQLWNAGADQAIGGTGGNADTQVGSDFTTGS
ncbi:MAG: putative Ig domain-containing protein, partial [Prosthecobacter sp.]|nr:putative Ig domain-containing protein [Prosthecobacter sp.]